MYEETYIYFLLQHMAVSLIVNAQIGPIKYFIFYNLSVKGKYLLKCLSLWLKLYSGWKNTKYWERFWKIF